MVKAKPQFVYQENGSVDIFSWLENLKNNYQIEDIEFLKSACLFTQEITEDALTFYQQPFLEFGMQVVDTLLDLKLFDHEMLIASLIGTSTPLIPENEIKIKKGFGENVVKLIRNLQKMEIVPNLNTPQNRSKNQTEQIRKMLLAMATDIRVVIIKLAERLCFLKAIKKIDSEARKPFAKEILDIYAPLANRLGMGQLKWELEDFAFHYLEPKEYKNIAAFLVERRIDRENRIQKIMQQLEEKLQSVPFEFKIHGRPKHIYSMYLKTQRKEISYQDIYDSSAVRILVPSIQDCYSVLSLVHSLWHPIMEEFDDYIAHPKENGYRSIHTTLADENHRHFEIQIRTFTMHEEAERGIAAHWAYKENKVLSEDKNAKISYLHQLLNWHQEVKDTAAIKKFDDEIYVITPMGEILNLSQGATPVDFAYHIHSELGHRCRGAKVNGQIVPLTYTLRTGDKVEIMTIIQGNPSRDWLNDELGYVKTTRAKDKISHWFRQQALKEDLEVGRNLLERELSKSGLGSNISLNQIARQLKLKNEETLLVSLARGNIRLMQIMQLIAPRKTTETISKPLSSIPNTRKNYGSAIIGGHDLLTRLAKCCKPIPGDAIVGYITQGRGISIHKESCNNFRGVNTERMIDVQWNPKNTNSFNTDLKIIAQNEKNILQDITGLFANEKIILLHLDSTLDNRENKIFIIATVQIQHVEELKHLLHKLKLLPSVITVTR